jgi:hypothetical protein
MTLLIISWTADNADVVGNISLDGMITVLTQTCGSLVRMFKTQMPLTSSMTRKILWRVGGCKLDAYYINNHVDNPLIY